jgi:hypothetical protein
LQDFHDPQRFANPIVPLTLMVDAEQVDSKCTEGRDLLFEAPPVAEGRARLDARIENIDRKTCALQGQCKATVSCANAAIVVRPGDFAGDDAYAACGAGIFLSVARSVVKNSWSVNGGPPKFG